MIYLHFPIRTLLLAAFLVVFPFGLRAEIAIVAGGCFWCVEKDFEHVKGVIEVQSGYAGGHTPNPTYKTYEKGGHIEVAKIDFDPAVISYGQLLEIFWRTIDPTDPGGQFCDRGHAYSTAIFALDAAQKTAAEKSKQQLTQSGKLKNPIVTPINESVKFWPAEDYHQNYYKKNSARYKYYRWACGRDKKVKKLWGNEAYRGVVKTR